MRFRRRPDTWLLRLSALTGVSRQDELLELGRLVDEIIEADADAVLLADWIGARYAVAVVSGSLQRWATGPIHHAGDVVVCNAFETIRSRSSATVVLVARAADADRVQALIGRARGRAAAVVTSAPLGQPLVPTVSVGGPM